MTFRVAGLFRGGIFSEFHRLVTCTKLLLRYQVKNSKSEKKIIGENLKYQTIINPLYGIHWSFQDTESAGKSL